MFVLVSVVDVDHNVALLMFNSVLCCSSSAHVDVDDEAGHDVVGSVERRSPMS